MSETMVCHFDGPQPYASDTTGDPTGHLGQVGTIGGGVIYRAGKHGKGIQLAEATTNLVMNPTMGGSYSGGLAPSVSEADAAGVLIPSENTDPEFIEVGQSSQKGEWSSYNSNSYLNFLMSGALSASTEYTWYLRFYLKSGAVDVVSWRGTSSYTEAFSTIGWHTFGITAMTDASGSNFTFLIRASSSPGTAVVFVDQAQVEQKPYKTPLCAGNMGTGHSWSGTAFASSSLRTAATLRYPVGVISGNAGTIALWYKPPAVHEYTAGNNPYLFYHYNSGNRIYIRHYGSTESSGFVLALGTGATSINGGSFTAEAWHHVAVTWSDGVGRLYVNGEMVGTVAYYNLSSMSEFYLGSNGTSLFSNGIYDELIVCDHAASAAAIRSYYEDGVLRIVGESESINLLDPDGLYLAQKGWRQQIAEPDGLGDYLDVVEALRLEWMNERDDERGPTVQRLNRLLAEARRKDPRRDPNSFAPVYLEARGHSESEMRYAVLREGKADELPERIWGPSGAVDVATKLTREGAWRAVAPRANALAWPVVSSTTIYNKQDADGDNYVTIDADDVYGDAEALAVITMDFDSGIMSRAIVAKMIGESADMDDFQSHYNILDEDSGAITKTDDTDAPGNKSYIFAPGGIGSNTVYWILDAAKIHAYQRTLAAFAGVEENGTVSTKSEIGIYSSIRGEYSDIDKQDTTPTVPSSPILFVNNGQLTIQNAYVPGQTHNANLRLYARLVANDAAASITLYNVFLIPLDGGVFTWDDGGEQTDIAQIDGRFERAYSTNSSGETVRKLKTYGPYLTITPGIDNRLFFYWAQYLNGQYHYMPNDSASIDVTIIPRYLALRGVL